MLSPLLEKQSNVFEGLFFQVTNAKKNIIDISLLCRAYNTFYSQFSQLDRHPFGEILFAVWHDIRVNDSIGSI